MNINILLCVLIILLSVILEKSVTLTYSLHEVVLSLVNDSCLHRNCWILSKLNVFWDISILNFKLGYQIALNKEVNRL